MSRKRGFWEVSSIILSVFLGIMAGYGYYTFVGFKGHIIWKALGILFSMWLAGYTAYNTAKGFGIMQNQEEDGEWFEATIKKAEGLRF